MEESSIYQWAMEKGEVRSLRKALIDLGTRRFGPPTAPSLVRINTIEDLEKLYRTTHRLLDATDRDDLLGTP
jgi:hypothetical protein